MQPNKVYESLAHLANNIIKNEQLRFELFNQPLFKDQFVRQINNMLALEKDFNQELYGEKWATIFAKAIVKIIGQKQRFEKPDGKSVEEIYGDYSSFLSYTTTTFMVGRNELVDDSIKFTEQDVLYSAILTEATKEHYKHLATQKAQAEQLAKEQAQNPQSKQNENVQQNNNFQQSSNQSSYFGGDFNQQQQGFMSMPVHPMQDPRFYPYNAKPKWMPIMKYILAILSIIGAIMLITATAVMMSLNLDLSAKEYGDALFTNAGQGSGMKVIWDGANWDDFIGKSNGKPLYDASFRWQLMGTNVMGIFGFLFYIIPAVYITYYAFRKPRSLAEKYRLNLWPLFFLILFFVLSMFQIIKFVSPGSIKTIFVNTYNQFLLNPKDVGEGFKGYDFDGWWNVVMDKYGQEINNLTTVIDVAIGIASTTIVFAIIILIINPKIDRQKVAEANMEFQKAAMAAMQGQSYQMNQALYENEDEIINAKPSKFAAWWHKIFKKKQNKDKDKSNNN